LPIGQHVFPAEKYRRIRERLLETKTAEPMLSHTRVRQGRRILLVHNPLRPQAETGTLSAREEMQTRSALFPELVQAFWLAAGGRFSPARHALVDGVAISHWRRLPPRFSDHGEGFV